MKTKYTWTNIIIILSILTVAYLYCLVYAPSIENVNDESLTNHIANMNKSCLINCKSDNCKNYIDNSRGAQYFISIPQSEQTHIKSCIITFWGFTHFMLYFVFFIFTIR